MQIVIVGCQAGDEGKGKFCDVLAENAYAVVRYHSGPNTGHTVVNAAGDFRFIQIPSGVLRGAIGVIGNGCVVDPRKLVAEMAELEALGVRADLRISETAHIVMPYHLEEDQALDNWRGDSLATSGNSGFATGGGRLGVTRRGVGPCRADKVARIGLRLIDLLDRGVLRPRLEKLLALKCAVLQQVYRHPIDTTGADWNLDGLIDEYHALGLRLAPHLCDTSVFLAAARAQDRTLIFEGSQSVGLDIEFGTYPYVSSGHGAAAGVTVGTGVPIGADFRVVGVSKCYMVTVGGGPLPTELGGDIAEHLVTRGREIGTVTGRRRRVGWLDLAFLRKAARVDGLDRLCLTNLDVLAGLPEIRVATHYTVGDRVLLEYPSRFAFAANLAPHYKVFPGWPDQDWSEVAAGGADALPTATREFIDFIATEVGVPVSGVSVGRRREQTLFLDDLLRPRAPIAA